MVNVAQLVRALDCGSKGRGFEPHLIDKGCLLEDSPYLFYYVFVFVTINILS